MPQQWMRGQQRMVQVTPKVTVPEGRYREWLQGLRPLPIQCEKPEDVEFFYRVQVDRGLLTREQANQLQRRHEQLEREEAGRGDALPDELVAELVRRGWQPPEETP